MKHKVSELEGALLDAAVALAEGIDVFVGYAPVRPVEGAECIAVCWLGQRGAAERAYRPSACWSDGGPIIERERIAIVPGVLDGTWEAATHGFITNDGGGLGSYDGWKAIIDRDNAAPSPLIAAMRSYVISKLGEEVELPDNA